MSEIKGLVRVRTKSSTRYDFFDNEREYLFTIDFSPNTILNWPKVISGEYANTIRDALNAQARHAEAVRLLEEVVPQIEADIIRDKIDAYLESERGESDANS